MVRIKVGLRVGATVGGVEGFPVGAMIGVAVILARLGKLTLPRPVTGSQPTVELKPSAQH